MPRHSGSHRAPLLVLAVAPLLAVPLAGARPLRIAGLYQVVGLALFAAMVSAAWQLRPAAGARDTSPDHRSFTGAVLLLTPFALIALLWVGLGTPWDATPIENGMRYAVLLAATVAVTSGFALIGETLAGPAPATASVGRTITLLAGAAYLVWTSFQLGAYSTLVSQGRVPDAVASIGNTLDSLLFAACALTYAANALFAAAMRRAGWLGGRGAIIHVAMNLAALLFLALRGLSFPDPTSSATSWYLQPGFVAGIPAIPWLSTYWLGVSALRTRGPVAEPVSGGVRGALAP